METSRKGLPAAWEPIESYLAAEHIELDDLELVGSGRAQTLRVLLDGEKLDLDRIAELSRGLSRLLDTLEVAVVDGPYQLEVSSPGLERRLSRPRHYQKSVGREVIVKTRDGQRRGSIDAADDATFTLLEGETKSVFAYADVVSARTVFTWEKPQKPGQRPK